MRKNVVMGVNNRAKRAAKAKKRAKDRARASHAPSGHVHDDPFFGGFDPSVESRIETEDHLRSFVHHHAQKRDTSSDLAKFARGKTHYQQQAFDSILSEVVLSLNRNGWSPDDVREIARRRVSARLTDYALGLVAANTNKLSPDTVDPAWHAQLEGVAPACGTRAWADQHAMNWSDARSEFIELLGALGALPVIEPTMARPGTWKPRKHAARTVDDRILSKVRGLLAKAESTDFEDEANALTAKAQDLMQTYSIEYALLVDDAQTRETPELRRVWIDAPYVDPKATLVQQVASSNRCESVFSAHLGFVSLVGFAADLDTVELLSTSLMFQASRAMRAEGTRKYRDGGSRTRSFRQSFLAAYALRIGERLSEATDETSSRIDAEHGGALLPVLAARTDEVHDYAEEVFPDRIPRSVSIPDQEGYGAGRAAADQADIKMRTGIDDGTGQ